MFNTIICVVGPSGSGKSYLADFSRRSKGIGSIVSYTTRAMRPGEVDGREHFFVSVKEMPPKGEMLAYTKFGGEHYWALHSQVPVGGVCCYVVDEKGLSVLTEEYGDRYRIVAVYIRCSLECLEKRGIDRMRVLRDRGRVVLEPGFYDVVIDNEGSLSDFENRILNLVA